MGKPLASRLLGHFDPAELKLITRSAAQLGSVPIDVLEDLVEEFAGEFSNGIELRGTADQAENLLTGVLPPDQVADIMSDVLGSSNRSIWEKIAAIPAPLLGDYLNEATPPGSRPRAFEAPVPRSPPRSWSCCRATSATRRRGAF